MTAQSLLRRLYLRPDAKLKDGEFPSTLPFVANGGAQFIIATHSPILMTYPEASLLSFDGDGIKPIRLEDTSHFQITKGILDSPGRYWKHLLKDDEPG
jgi:predicted ATPase